MQFLVPVISFLVTALLKKAKNRIPNEALPVVAVITGVVCQVAGDVFNITNGAALAGTVLNADDGGVLAGIVSGNVATGLHQIFSQYGKRPKKPVRAKSRSGRN